MVNPTLRQKSSVGYPGRLRVLQRQQPRQNLLTPFFHPTVADEPHSNMGSLRLLIQNHTYLPSQAEIINGSLVVFGILFQISSVIKGMKGWRSFKQLRN